MPEDAEFLVRGGKKFRKTIRIARNRLEKRADFRYLIRIF